MTPKLKKLVEQWKEESTYRDCGESARKTWAKIKKIATPEEQVQILEDQFHEENNFASWKRSLTC
ncbi:MAG: hypothetical protein WCW87_00580 [Candidatus Paceibacterota bacterium]